MSKPRFVRIALAGAVSLVGVVGLVRLQPARSRSTAIAAPETATPPSSEPARNGSVEPGANDVRDDETDPATLAEQRELLFQDLAREHGLDDATMAKIRAVFAASPILGQGNPAISKHPMTRAECRRTREEAGISPARLDACGGPDMVPIYDAEHGEGPADARVCIDQLEFPDVPCAYPVVEARASEAAELCEAMGKRLCDAHEWEGACAGSVNFPSREYRWGWPREESNYAHNILRTRVWAYGATKDHALCATGSFVTPGCDGGNYAACGSNTYPAGAFPACQSSFGVFDQHGNVAEHMSLPTLPEELAGQGGDGFTEMKGSWFAFQHTEAHEDDCRFRAPAWHETRVSNEKSHRNYHLGFRCCRDVEPRAVFLEADASRKRPSGYRSTSPLGRLPQTPPSAGADGPRRFTRSVRTSRAARSRSRP